LNIIVIRYKIIHTFFAKYIHEPQVLETLQLY
jgi:hypothetical protein